MWMRLVLIKVTHKLMFYTYLALQMILKFKNHWGTHKNYGGVFSVWTIFLICICKGNGVETSLGREKKLYELLRDEVYVR